MDTSHLYASPASLWHSPQHGIDEKRGSVIMGQPPAQPPPKRKGGRKPKDDPVNTKEMLKSDSVLFSFRNGIAVHVCNEIIDHGPNINSLRDCSSEFSGGFGKPLALLADSKPFIEYENNQHWKSSESNRFQIPFKQARTCP